MAGVMDTPWVKASELPGHVCRYPVVEGSSGRRRLLCEFQSRELFQHIRVWPQESVCVGGGGETWDLGKGAGRLSQNFTPPKTKHPQSRN